MDSSDQNPKYPFPSRYRLHAYKGRDWTQRELPERGEDLANTYDRLLWELEIATSALRRALKQVRAGEDEKNLWECRKQWWVAWYRVDNFHRNFDKDGYR